MPDIGVKGFAGKIDSPNPFWLAIGAADELRRA